MSSVTGYRPVINEDLDINEPKSADASDLDQSFSTYERQRIRGRFAIVLVATTIAVLAFAVLCLALGRQFGASCEENPYWLASPGPVKTTFEYQKVVALRTSNETRERWSSLFPPGGGFVKHPVISPEMASLALYHQLHCLDTIREAYWAALDNIEAHHHTSTPHVRHCIDYLRQALLCHADASLEPPDMELGGVTGFGVERKCRDVSKLRAWAEEWMVGDSSHDE